MEKYWTYSKGYENDEADLEMESKEELLDYMVDTVMYDSIEDEDFSLVQFHYDSEGNKIVDSVQPTTLLLEDIFINTDDYR